MEKNRKGNSSPSRKVLHFQPTTLEHIEPLVRYRQHLVFNLSLTNPTLEQLSSVSSPSSAQELTSGRDYDDQRLDKDYVEDTPIPAPKKRRPNNKGRSSSSKSNKNKQRPPLQPQVSSESDHHSDDGNTKARNQRSSKSQRELPLNDHNLQAPGSQSEGCDSEITDEDNEETMVDTRKQSIKKKKAAAKTDGDSDPQAARIVELEKQLKAAKAEKEVANADVQLALSGGKGVKHLQKLGVKAAIKKVTGAHLWRTCKFIQDDVDLHKKANKVLTMLNIDGYMVKDDMSDEDKAPILQKRKQWIQIYCDCVRTYINDRRSYVQTRMKEIVVDYMKQRAQEFNDPNKKDTFLPTVKDLERVVLRDIDDDDADKQAELEKLFDFYITDLLKVVAGYVYWPEKIHGRVQVSTHLVGGVEGRFAIPPSTEAMTLVLFENCRGKWIKFHCYKEIEGKEGAIPPHYSKEKEAETARFKAKYSDAHSGQSPYGGWSEEGVDRFWDLQELIAKNRMDNYKGEDGDQESIQEKIARHDEAAMIRICNARARANGGNGGNDGGDGGDGDGNPPPNDGGRPGKRPRRAIIEED